MEYSRIMYPLLFILLCFILFAFTENQIEVKKSAFTNGVAVSSEKTNQSNGSVGQTLVGKSSNSVTTINSGYIYHKSALVTEFEPAVNLAEQKFDLKQNYPNPFNPTTAISYQLPTASHVDLHIFNIIGQKVASLVSKRQQAGSYKIEWDAGGYSSGVYFYRIQAGSFIAIKKLILMK